MISSRFILIKPRKWSSVERHAAIENLPKSFYDNMATFKNQKWPVGFIGW